MGNGRFDGRVAVVTGAGQGIGRAVAERFGADGAAVVVADLNDAAAAETVAAIEGDGGRALAVHVDITRPDEVERLVASATGAFGSIDVLVNNAGGLRSTPAADVTADEWHLVVDSNLTGAFLCARAAYPALRASGPG
ncbi:MAG: SDR family NAD(P)-dependent oxidoreductase, partial [Chloroflexota bacterium]|nr:SDR family NAD(P)-dependent oxidoreductase [Chloroflexota bacterium]